VDPVIHLENAAKQRLERGFWVNQNRKGSIPSALDLTDLSGFFA